MDLKCLTRKRIWEVDCLSLDAALAASFDWRELINILQGNGHAFDLQKPEAVLEYQAQSLIHEYCHYENEVATRIESLLNEWNKKIITTFDSWTPTQVAEYVLTASWNKKSAYAALFWALGSDSRNGFECIRRKFHQRFQIFSVRKLAA